MFIRVGSRYWKAQAYRSRLFLLDFSLVSPSGAGAQSSSARAFTRGASDSIDCLFAFICCGSRKHCALHTRGAPYLAIIEDITETSGDRLEGDKGIGRFFDSIEDHFGPRICERLEIRFFLVFRTGANDGI